MKLRFDDTFEMELNMSETEFLDNIYSVMDFNFSDSPFYKTNRLYTGNIESNQFILHPIRKPFSFNNISVGSIKGTFRRNDNKLQVKGKITNYKTTFFFIACYIVLPLCLALYLFYTNQKSYEVFVVYSVFSIIGIFNFLQVIRKLKRLKNNFITVIKQFESNPIH